MQTTPVIYVGPVRGLGSHNTLDSTQTTPQNADMRLIGKRTTSEGKNRSPSLGVAHAKASSHFRLQDDMDHDLPHTSTQICLKDLPRLWHQASKTLQLSSPNWHVGSRSPELFNLFNFKFILARPNPTSFYPACRGMSKEHT